MGPTRPRSHLLSPLFFVQHPLAWWTISTFQQMLWVGPCWAVPLLTWYLGFGKSWWNRQSVYRLDLLWYLSISHAVLFLLGFAAQVSILANTIDAMIEIECASRRCRWCGGRLERLISHSGLQQKKSLNSLQVIT